MERTSKKECGAVPPPRLAGPTPVEAASAFGSAVSGGTGELSAWLARYEPVERTIMEARERRLANRVRLNAERREADARAFGDLCEATEGLAVVWRREGWSVRDMVEWADGDVWTLLTLARWLRQEATRRINALEGALRRPFYYTRESARRRILADERRKIRRRSTTSPCPTREQVLEAWMRRRESHEAAVRFGSMVHDLECYLDNSLLRSEDGVIVGRRGGVKAWLQENIPVLYVRYTTVMRYKAMAKKLRQVTGLADPTPADVVLAAEDDGDETSVEVARARAAWREVSSGAGKSPTALMARIDMLLDPRRVGNAGMLTAWQAKYMNEITVRTKSCSERRIVDKE